MLTGETLPACDTAGRVIRHPHDIRTRRGLTERELGASAHAHPNYIRGLEHGGI